MADDLLIIVGQGPAGLSAAIYAGRAGIPTRVLGCAPKVAGDWQIDNYFGFPETISGRELIERGMQQAQRFGAEILCQRVLGIHAQDDGRYTVKTEAGEHRACAVILATGVARVRPGIENLTPFEGKGVSYCVSCDGFFYRGRRVLVLGEGVFAANQALELMQYTPQVSICTQGKAADFTGEFGARLIQAGIAVRQDRIQRLEGEGELSAVVYASGERQPLEGLFIAMGQASASDFAYSLGLVRNGEFIQVNEQQATNLPGVFAAGDCVGRFLQISVAVGEGAIAARAAIAHIKKGCRAQAPSA
jgi:thioredoxin reductase (NADPH)